MIYAGTNTVVVATTNNFATGLTGTIGVQVVDLAGAVKKARTTAGITELVAGSGSYVASIDLTTASMAPGHYFVFWDNGSVSPGNVAQEDLLLHVTTSMSTALRTLSQGLVGNNAENISVGLFVQ